MGLQKNVFSDFYANRKITRQAGHNNIKFSGHYDVQCFSPDGSLKWEDVIENIVVNVGLDYILDTGLGSGTAIYPWYLGLTATSPSPAGADTMSSHGGWTENQNYSEATRVLWQDGAVASQSIDNSANKAEFNMVVDSDTVGGCFLTSDNTKGGTGGTLYSAGAFSTGDKSVGSGDLLQVTATFGSADDGV